VSTLRWSEVTLEAAGSGGGFTGGAKVASSLRTVAHAIVAASSYSPSQEEHALMRRLIWLPIAGFLLIAGAALAAASSAPSATPTKQANQDSSSPAPSAAASPSTTPGNANSGTEPGTPPDGKPGMGFGFGHAFATGSADLLDQVLSDLVKAGTITQAQSDAITQGLKQAITDKQTELEQQRQQAEQEWTQIQGFLADGVISQAEVDQLPADSPFRQVFDSIAKDGQVTTDQLQQLRPFGPGGDKPGPGGPGMHIHIEGPGGSWDFGGPDQNPQASPSATGTSS
jgi:polyhydroxyalkanoate synthesis regulator phasin